MNSGSPLQPGDPMDGLPRLHIEPDVAQIARARDFVNSGLGPEPVDPLFLVGVSEVVTNAINEHNRLGTSAQVIVAVDPDELAVHVLDQGRGYRPEPRQPAEALEGGGRGLVIAAAVAPGLRWRPNTPTGTIFTLPYPAGDTD